MKIYLCKSSQLYNCFFKSKLQIVIKFAKLVNDLQHGTDDFHNYDHHDFDNCLNYGLDISTFHKYYYINQLLGHKICYINAAVKYIHISLNKEVIFPH